MGRAHDITIPAGTSWLADPAAQALCAAVSVAGYDIYFVGGCVRNALLGLPDSDVDMATNARPEQVIAVSEASGFKAVPTGIDHGTVTIVVEGRAFEVTTFRRDVATDGRRAVVAFSDRISDDARRRDFTMNALYATPAGAVIDPLGGIDDLLARRVRFIEDAGARITEDYLRILRFFRFSAWYADLQQGFDPETLAAISGNTTGLETLSAERVGQEMVKLLSAPDPAPAVATMRQSGVLPVILPGTDDRYLAVLVHMETALGLDADWIRRLVIIGGDDPAARFRLSRADAKVLDLIREAAFDGPSLAEIAYRQGERVALGAALVRAALAETMPDDAILETVIHASQAVFPVSAEDLMPDLQGPALGRALRALESRWIASGFTLTAAELLGRT